MIWLKRIFPLFFFLLSVSPAGLSPWDGAAAADLAAQYHIVLGPAEVVRGPDKMTDNPFHTLVLDGTIRAYLGNQYSIGYSGQSLESLRQFPFRVLAQGTAFDSCGAWLNSTWQDGAIIHGWYHAETNCHYPATDKSVGYAESMDGGRFFTKPGYPHNQVITAPAWLPGSENDEGDQHVIQIGDYLYMYFLASRDWQIHLARSSISDGGKPGTFWKYYQGAFDQPGIGGESSPIAPASQLARSWISYDSALGVYIGFSYQKRWYSSLPDQYAGLGLTISPDGISQWQSLPYLVLPDEGAFWGRDENSLELTEYPSLISLSGDDRDIGNSFWLYYMALNAGDGFDRRYLVRRKVWLEKTALTSPVDTVPRVALSGYQKGNDTWYTTKQVTSGYQYVNTIGYLFTDAVENSIPVYDCTIPAWRDHMLVPGDADCGGRDIELNSRAGWISTVPFLHSQAIYRCFDAQKNNHFISKDAACDGKTLEWRMGYAAQEEIPGQQ